jgi:hypothetical protein
MDRGYSSMKMSFVGKNDVREFRNLEVKTGAELDSE